MKKLKDHLAKLEVASEIYHDYGRQKYPNKSEADIATLKMKLLKKEMLLLCYYINKDIEQIGSE